MTRLEKARQALSDVIDAYRMTPSVDTAIPVDIKVVELEAAAREEGRREGWEAAVEKAAQAIVSRVEKVRARGVVATNTTEWMLGDADTIRALGKEGPK